ncbi:MAG: dienelactone hydrolase family protein [bacterium]
MSHGGMTVLDVIKQSTSDGLEMSPFRAAIALYPLCGEPAKTDTSLLILIGDEDTWTPAELCIQYVDRLDKPDEMTLKVFQGAHHLFDHPGIDIVELGYILRSNPEATEQARRLAHEFLDVNLVPE